MDLNQVKQLVRSNNVFESMDDQTGYVDIPNGPFHDIEYGPPAFFEEGGSPPAAPVNTVKTEKWDSANFTLVGATEADISKAYLGAFYNHLLKSLTVNQGAAVGAKSINSDADLNQLFEGFSGQWTSQVCMLTAHIDFSKILNANYSAPILGICINKGMGYYCRDLLSWGEPLVLLPGGQMGRLLTAERFAVVLNVPQALNQVSARGFQTTLQYKVIRPDCLKLYAVK